MWFRWGKTHFRKNHCRGFSARELLHVESDVCGTEQLEFFFAAGTCSETWRRCAAIRPGTRVQGGAAQIYRTGSMIRNESGPARAGQIATPSPRPAPEKPKTAPVGTRGRRPRPPHALYPGAPLSTINSEGSRASIDSEPSVHSLDINIQAPNREVQGRSYASGSVTDRPSHPPHRLSATGGRGNWQGPDTGCRRRMLFKEWDSRNPSYNIPHGTASSAGIPQLKVYDITLPKWVDTDVPEQRMHLRLYYSDLLSARPTTPPVDADADCWEVRIILRPCWFACVACATAYKSAFLQCSLLILLLLPLPCRLRLRK